MPNLFFCQIMVFEIIKQNKTNIPEPLNYAHIQVSLRIYIKCCNNDHSLNIQN